MLGIQVIDDPAVARVADSTAFGGGFSQTGPGEIDLETNPGFYGGNSGAGGWHVSLVQFDALSLTLSQNLVIGQQYSLTFLAMNQQQFTAGTGPLLIGTSSSATSFGTQVYSTGMFATPYVWTSFAATFTATSADGYLTVEGSQGAGGVNSWMIVDGITLNAVPAPGALGVLGLGGLLGARRRRA